MNYSILIVLSLLLATSSCVKEEGKISSGDAATDTGDETTPSTEVPGEPDPLASQAWHLDNTGQTSFSIGAGTSGEDIDLVDVIDNGDGYTGEGVRIAVSDSGTDIDHEDLTGTQLVGEHRNYGINNPNLWRTTLPDFVEDDAHGTAVAGLIAAEGWNGIGSRGVAPGAKYAAFRFVGDYTATEASYLARSIDQTDGDFDIFNYSYGFDQCEFTEVDSSLLDAFEDGVTSLRGSLGAIYVQSAGNSFDGDCAGNTNASADLTTPYKIIAGAINADGEKSSYSTPGSGIWVSAPGGEYGTSGPAMVTTDISGCSHGYSQLTYVLNAFNGGRNSLNNQCSYTSMMNGTSSAAPVLSGVIALMLQAQPLLSWRDVKYILANTAEATQDQIFTGLTPYMLPISDPIDNPVAPGLEPMGYVYDYKWIQNAAGINFSNWYGFGRVNALAAVLAATTYTFPLGTYMQALGDSGAIIVPIPEDDSEGTLTLNALESTLVVPEDYIIESVQIEVTITDPDLTPDLSDIGINLISPNGTESRILLYNSGITATEIPAGKILLSNAFFGEHSNGAWQIKVIDAETNGDLAVLENWKITINGHNP